jgi:predicted PurR-regulated permease PerM
MTEFLKSFQTPNTWTGVILVGILVTIFTTYLIRFFDARRSSRQKDADRKYKADLDRLRADQRHEKIFSNLETRSRLQAIEQLVQFCAVTILLMILAIMGYPGWLLFPFGLFFAFSWFVFVHFSRAARRVERLLTEFYSTTPLQDEIQKKM